MGIHERGTSLQLNEGLPEVIHVHAGFFMEISDSRRATVGRPEAVNRIERFPRFVRPSSRFTHDAPHPQIFFFCTSNAPSLLTLFKASESHITQLRLHTDRRW